MTPATNTKHTRKRSAYKKSGGLKRAMPVHYLPKYGSITLCGRCFSDVFSNDDRKHVGCKSCLRALGAQP